MCYSVYMSTDSTADLRVHNTDLLRFQKAEEYEYKQLPIIDLLEFPNKWYVGSQSECSCTFRHLNEPSLGFGVPEDWYEEEQADLDATKEMYAVLVSLLTAGHHVDCIDVWEGTKPEDVKTLAVSLDEVPGEAFRLFENHKFVFTRTARPPL
jgi:hypothetical protein